jgi:hypothetical protein
MANSRLESFTLVLRVHGQWTVASVLPPSRTLAHIPPVTGVWSSVHCVNKFKFTKCHQGDLQTRTLPLLLTLTLICHGGISKGTVVRVNY